MGHLIWNRVIDGKLTPSKATNLLLSTKKNIYIIGVKNNNCVVPTVIEVYKEVREYMGYCNYSHNAGIFKLHTSGYHFLYPGQTFPCRWNEFFVDNMKAVLDMSGDYEAENDEPALSGFVADMYGTLQNPLSPKTDFYKRTLGWCSLWWTEDKKKANQMLKLIKAYLK